jgi:hypothetical protein
MATLRNVAGAVDLPAFGDLLAWRQRPSAHVHDRDRPVHVDPKQQAEQSPAV